jgi:phosphatidylglycerophosphate synthase
VSLTSTSLPTPGKVWGWCIDHNHLWVVNQIPNALTLIRVLAPLTFYLSYRSFSYYGDTVSAIGWLLATGGLVFTDFLDGRAARSLGHVSKFGKLMDPVMDKVTGITGIVLFLALVDQAKVGTALDYSTHVVSYFMIAIELSLVVIAILGVVWLNTHARAGKSTQTGESKLGANKFGKRKFLTQSATLAVSYFTIYLAGPVRGNLSAIIYTAGMSAAVYFGAQSLDRHIHDAREVRRGPQSSQT